MEKATFVSPLPLGGVSAQGSDTVTVSARDFQRFLDWQRTGANSAMEVTKVKSITREVTQEGEEGNDSEVSFNLVNGVTEEIEPIAPVVPRPVPSAFLPSVSPPSFSGEATKLGPREFLKLALRVKQSRQIPENIFLQCWVPSMLTGPAYDWWLDNGHFTDWDQFAIALIEEFQLPIQDDLIMERLLQRRQGTRESVVQYVEVMQKLMSQMVEPMSSREKVRIVFRNLLPDIRVLLCTHSYVTVRQLMSDAVRVENTIDGIKPRSVSGNLRENIVEMGNIPVGTASAGKRETTTVNRGNPREGECRVRCYNCQQIGHYSYDCTLPLRKRDFVPRGARYAVGAPVESSRTGDSSLSSGN